MGLSAASLHSALNDLARSEPVIARAIKVVGIPHPRISERGYATLLQTIVGQQLSTPSARTIWKQLQVVLGDAADPSALMAAPEAMLLAAGLSRQKAGYARSLAGMILAGKLDLQNLPQDDEEAIAALVSVKGIGRWSAEVYLLFAEGRADIWPAGDLAVRVAVGHIFGLTDRPSEKLVRSLAEVWRPHRGAAAIFAWHHYNFRIIIADGNVPLKMS